MSEIQYDALDPTLQQQFDAWKELPGSKQVLRRAYAIASFYARRYQASGRKVTVALIWEQLRDKIDGVREYCQKRGYDLTTWRGYTLNNNLRAYLARHIISHHPEWNGMFRMREVGKTRSKRTGVLVLNPHRETAHV